VRGSARIRSNPTLDGTTTDQFQAETVDAGEFEAKACQNASDSGWSSYFRPSTRRSIREPKCTTGRRPYSAGSTDSSDWQYRSSNQPTGTKQVVITVQLDRDTCTLKLIPRTASDSHQRTLEQALKRNISDVLFPRVVNGLGTEARYQDWDIVIMFRSGETSVEEIVNPRTTRVLAHDRAQAQAKTHAKPLAE
jgi:hypothetical protein